jgi:hypothetical protein
LGNMKDVTGQLRSTEKQNGSAEKSKHQPIAPTSDPLRAGGEAKATTTR